MIFENERFESFIDTHVFGRIKIHIYDKDGDEDYALDMPPRVYEELKNIITIFEKNREK